MSHLLHRFGVSYLSYPVSDAKMIRDNHQTSNHDTRRWHIINIRHRIDTKCQHCTWNIDLEMALLLSTQKFFLSSFVKVKWYHIGSIDRSQNKNNKTSRKCPLGSTVWHLLPDISLPQTSSSSYSIVYRTTVALILKSRSRGIRSAEMRSMHSEDAMFF